MHKFYYRFQWAGAILLPAIFLLFPILRGLDSEWNNQPVLSWVFAGLMFTILLTIAIVTTSTARRTGKNYLGLRVTTLIESSYLSVIAMLLTNGHQPKPVSMVVTVLTNVGVDETTAWTLNGIAQYVMAFLTLLFLSTALVSALLERLSFKHRSIEAYTIIPPDED